MTEPASFSDAELHALADDRLEAPRREALEAWLATHPEEAARVAFYKRLNGELHRLFDPVLDSPIPVEMPLAPPRRWLKRVAAAGIAASLVGLGIAGGWAAHMQLVPERVVEVPAAAPTISAQAALAHSVYTVEVRHPVEVAAGDRAHLVAWLSKRLDTPLRAPDLAAQGFELVGGRLLPGERGPSAQLMYQDAQGLRVTLYVARNDAAGPASAFRFEQAGPVQSFYWIDAGLGYVLSGELPRERLSALATAVHRALEAPAPTPR